MMLIIGAAVAHAGAAPPATFVMDGRTLADVKQRIADDDPALRKAASELRREAQDALHDGPWSVMDKQIIPPSGDKHDYMSVGPYWWPDPETDDGLPYVRRDGERNPERNNYDNVGLNRVIQAARALSLAAYLFDEPRYAERAATLLRVWFLDEATRMNPHLQFGQAIPGRVTGRGIGIIDTHNLPELLDAVALLRTTDAWSRADHEALRAWFEKYLEWMLTSEHGQAEARTRNNHAVWYDAQVAAIALFVNNHDTAKRVLGDVGPRRIATQIEPDGRMPHELARTKSFDYTRFNLDAFVTLAELARHVDGVDLWAYETDDGRTLRAALDWYAPFVAGEEQWTHKQIKPIRRGGAATLYRRAARLAARAGDTARTERYERLYQQVNATGATPTEFDVMWPSP